MTRFKALRSAVCAALGLTLSAFAPAAYSDTTYTYTGNYFNDCVPGECTPNTFLSGSITLTAPLSSSISTAQPYYSDLVSATFTDNGALGVSISLPGLGVNIGQANGLYPAFFLGTDASGAINSWFISIGYGPPNTTSFQNIYTSSPLICCGFDVAGGHDYVSSSDGASTAVMTVNGDPGTWICTSGCPAAVSPVPEPEVYAMLLAGLGLLGFEAYRRKLTKWDRGFAFRPGNHQEGLL